MHSFNLLVMADAWGLLASAGAFLLRMGVQRIRSLGGDDPLATFLLPCLGLTITAAMLSAIVHGLTPDERWAQRHHPEFGTIPTAWGPVLGVILALMLGATALMATVSFVGQRLFEALLAT